MAIDAELTELLQFTQKLWAATDRRYDITVAPLTSLWGYGPAGSNLPVPSAEKLNETLTFVGSDKLTLDAAGSSLRKSHPRVQLDLGSVLQGYAADRVAKCSAKPARKISSSKLAANS
ncbi:FAD:protein FMN transferase [Verrucomicrobiota bacterium]|nr:FAD:protein FMN transferase [Verrucomicrobiota bacterium]